MPAVKPQAINLTPQPLANPIVNIQNAPAAPEFGGAMPSVGTRPTMYGLETDALLILLHLHHWLPAYCRPYDNTDEYFSQINLASIPGEATEQVRRIKPKPVKIFRYNGKKRPNNFGFNLVWDYIIKNKLYRSGGSSFKTLSIFLLFFVTPFSVFAQCPKAKPFGIRYNSYFGSGTLSFNREKEEYFECYSVTSRSLPLDSQEIAKDAVCLELQTKLKIGESLILNHKIRTLFFSEKIDLHKRKQKIYLSAHKITLIKSIPQIENLQLVTKPLVPEWLDSFPNACQLELCSNKIKSIKRLAKKTNIVYLAIDLSKVPVKRKIPSAIFASPCLRALHYFPSEKKLFKVSKEDLERIAPNIEYLTLSVDLADILDEVKKMKKLKVARFARYTGDPARLDELLPLKCNEYGECHLPIEYW